MSSRTWNPRFLHYCRVRGFENNPRAMLEHDTKEYPGRKMDGFADWLDRKWSEWYAQRPKGRPDVVTEDHHQQFDAWLATCAA